MNIMIHLLLFTIYRLLVLDRNIFIQFDLKINLLWRKVKKKLELGLLS
jgi:hypothetical protein